MPRVHVVSLFVVLWIRCLPLHLQVRGHMCEGVLELVPHLLMNTSKTSIWACGLSTNWFLIGCFKVLLMAVDRHNARITYLKLLSLTLWFLDAPTHFIDQSYRSYENMISFSDDLPHFCRIWEFKKQVIVTQPGSPTSPQLANVISSIQPILHNRDVKRVGFGEFGRVVYGQGFLKGHFHLQSN